jgi:DNA-binding HxlR family transcriptional regulator
MNQKKKSKPKKRAAGLVIAAPLPRPASPDDPSLKLFREAKEAQERQTTAVPQYRSTAPVEQLTVDSKEIGETNPIATTGVPEYRSKQIIPEKNFYRKANQTADQLDKTLSPAESKVLDHLLRLSVGFNKKTCQIRVSKLQERTGYRSDKTVRAAINGLEMKGIIKRLSHHNSPLGDEYEIYGYSGNTAVPQYRSTAVESTAVLESKITGHLKTIVKDKENDDEAFAGLLALLKEASKEITGKAAQAGESDRWRELGELLVTELRIAGARTTISSMPAFLTEHLRRRLWKMDKKQISVEGKSDSTDDKPSLSTEKAKDCRDCGGTGFFYPNGFEGGVAKCKHKQQPDGK